MKKTVALIVCIIMAFSLCACGKEAAQPDEGEVGMPNPMTEYNSLDEINEAVGGELAHPAVMGVSDESYFIIDCGNYKIAEYNFNVAGYDYCYRCAEVDEDISGVYMGGDGTAFKDGKCDGIQFNSDDEYKCARWFDGDMQYVLSVSAPDMEQETFESIADELMHIYD